MSTEYAGFTNIFQIYGHPSDKKADITTINDAYPGHVFGTPTTPLPEREKGTGLTSNPLVGLKYGPM